MKATHIWKAIILLYLVIFYYFIILRHLVSIIRVLRHRQDGCCLEVLGNKVIDEEKDISHEEEENSEVLVVDGDDNHAPIVNIYKLLI